MTRLAPLACAGLLSLAFACGPAPRAPAPAAPAPLHMSPVTDLAPAAGISWLIEARPRTLLEQPGIASLVDSALGRNLDAFATRHGVDLRNLDEAALAGYGDATLFLGAGPVNTFTLERLFRSHASFVEGRAEDRANTKDGHALWPVTRLWGDVDGERTQMAILGIAGVAVERGRFGPLRAAEAFAQGRLHKASPALRAEPLASAAAAVGPGLLRAFAAGPFTGDWARGVGGLLAAATSVGAALAFLPANAPGGATDGDPSAVARLRVALVDVDEAGRGRLVATFDRFAQSAFGRLAGLDHPRSAADVRKEGRALVLQVDLDPRTLARGIHGALDATMAELLSY